jgi:hypothetical protein
VSRSLFVISALSLLAGLSQACSPSARADNPSGPSAFQELGGATADSRGAARFQSTEAVKQVWYWRRDAQAREHLYDGAGQLTVQVGHTLTFRQEGRNSNDTPAELTNASMCAGFGCSGTGPQWHLVDNHDGTWTVFADAVALPQQPDADLTGKADGVPILIAEIHVEA